MGTRVDSVATTQAPRSVQTADAQPQNDFTQVHIAGEVGVPSSASTTQGPRGTTVVVRSPVSQVVSVPYDAERESQRQENLRGNRLVEDVRPSTANTR